ncbi:MAG: radical SAM protein, partial [Acidobacteria bacterium]|nr:radical SAM protein [Acidobacteriota bacterium]
TTDRHLQQIMELIHEVFPLAAPQTTFEGHIGTLTRDKMRFVRSLGFNRLSAGVQTFDPELRRVLNLTPTLDEIRGCLDAARDEGLDDFNLDMMFNLPGQTSAIWKRDLLQAVALRPSGLDVYETVMAHSTALHRQVMRGELRRERDPRVLAFNYLLAESILGESGYQQKNLFVWNREGFENKLLDSQSDLRDHSVHIVGAGLTAYSVIDGQAFINEAGLKAYIGRVRGTGHGIKWSHQCTPREERERFMIASLEEFRFNRRRFAECFGEDMDQLFATQLRSFSSRRLIEPEPGGYRLTPLGRAWASTMSIEFYGEPALREILGARLRHNYFGGMTTEEEFDLPLFAAYHPRQVLSGWNDFSIVLDFVGLLERQNPTWRRSMVAMLLGAVGRYGLPAIAWWCQTLLRQLGRHRSPAPGLQSPMPLGPSRPLVPISPRRRDSTEPDAPRRVRGR